MQITKLQFKDHLKNIFKIVLINIFIFALFYYLYQFIIVYIPIFHSSPCNMIELITCYGTTDIQIWLMYSMVVIGIIFTLLLSIKLLKINFWLSAGYFIFSLIISFLIGIFLGLLVSIFGY